MKYIIYFLSLATVLSAHRSWILPAQTSFADRESWVCFDACISNELFSSNEHPMDASNMVYVDPKGETNMVQSAVEHETRTVFDLKLSEKGTYQIHAERFMYFASWEEKNVETGEKEKKRFRGDIEELKEKELLKKEGLKLGAFQIKNATYITRGEPSKEALITTEKGLDIKFHANHPNDLFTDEEVSFTVLYDGKPIEGVALEVIRGNERFRDNKIPISLHTDENGVVKLKFDQPGKYWINAGYLKENAGELEGVLYDLRSKCNVTLEVFPQ